MPGQEGIKLMCIRLGGGRGIEIAFMYQFIWTAVQLHKFKGPTHPPQENQRFSRWSKPLEASSLKGWKEVFGLRPQFWGWDLGERAPSYPYLPLKTRCWRIYAIDLGLTTSKDGILKVLLSTSIKELSCPFPVLFLFVEFRIFRKGS